ALQMHWWQWQDQERARVGAEPRRSPHRSEVDREAADVASIQVSHDQDQSRLRRDLLDGKSIDAPREVSAAVRANRGALVLDEGRIALPIAQEDQRRVERREVLSRPSEISAARRTVLM